VSEVVEEEEQTSSSLPPDTERTDYLAATHTIETHTHTHTHMTSKNKVCEFPSNGLQARTNNPKSL